MYVRYPKGSEMLWAGINRVARCGTLIPSAHQMCWFLTFCMSGQKREWILPWSLDWSVKVFILYSLRRISLICAYFNLDQLFGNSSCHLLAKSSYCLKWIYIFECIRNKKEVFWQFIFVRMHWSQSLFISFPKRSHIFPKHGMYSLCWWSQNHLCF